MSELIPSKAPIKRRRYSKAFKARILAACEQHGATIAGVALANGLNANLVHNWRRQARVNTGPSSDAPAFVPIAMPGTMVHSPEPVVIFEVASIKVHWPLAHIDRSIAWLRVLQS